MQNKVKLPSNATLILNPAPFADAKELYQALLREAKGVRINTKEEVFSVLKEVLFGALSSPEVEAALWKCMARSLYNDMKIVADTFEPVSAREDYLTVCYEVTKENVLPFVKSLYVKYGPAIKKMFDDPK